MGTKLLVFLLPNYAAVEGFSSNSSPSFLSSSPSTPTRLLAQAPEKGSRNDVQRDQTISLGSEVGAEEEERDYDAIDTDEEYDKEQQERKAIVAKLLEKEDAEFKET